MLNLHGTKIQEDQVNIVHIVNSLDVIENKSLVTEAENLEDLVEIAPKNFENHPSVLSIKKTIIINKHFQFSKIAEEILCEINNLDNEKSRFMQKYSNQQLEEVY